MLKPEVIRHLQLVVLCTTLGIDLERLQREHAERKIFRRRAREWFLRRRMDDVDLLDEHGLEAFHNHLEQCSRCRNQPFNLCSTGAELLRATPTTD